MRLQTDQEFKQRNIKKFNKKFDAEMYITHLRGGKAFAAEQKTFIKKYTYRKI